MRAFNLLFHSAVIAAAGVMWNADAADSTFPTEPGLRPYNQQDAAPVQSTAPSVNNEKFRQLRTQCESEAACGKASGDVCDAAAALLLGTDLPDEFREVSEDQRVKIALRLLERGVDSSNFARAHAYDWYNKVGFLGVAAYADPYRARELMDMMVKAGYPGGELRKIRGQTSILSFTSSEADKRAGCTRAKQLLSEGKLDAESAKIAQDVVGSGICVGYEPVKQ